MLYDSRFLKECSSECILGVIGCLAKRKVVLSAIDKWITDVEIKACIGKGDVHGRTTFNNVADGE